MKEKIHSSPFENFIKKENSPPKKVNTPKSQNKFNNNSGINEIVNDDFNNSNNNKELYDNNNKTNNYNSDMYILKRKQNMIDPESIPHPSEFEDYYLNINQENIFSTSVGRHPPHSISKYIVNETENSSCRLIRSSLIKFPTDQSLLNKTGILFGLYCQPLAEYNEKEKKIPKVYASQGFFRCKNCNAYANNKCKLIYKDIGNRKLICNICNTENDVLNDDLFNDMLNEQLALYDISQTSGAPSVRILALWDGENRTDCKTDRNTRIHPNAALYELGGMSANEGLLISKSASFQVSSATKDLTDSVLWLSPEPDMGDVATLRSFLTWAAENYSASNIVLMLNDHGAGTVYETISGGLQTAFNSSRTLCTDDTNGSGLQLSALDVKNAIKQIAVCKELLKTHIFCVALLIIL